MREILRISGDFFDPKHIFECGQVFRHRPQEGGYRILAKDQCAVVSKCDGGYVCECSDADFFRRYLDLDTDYGRICSAMSKNALLREAFEFGRGIRILRQDKFEALISFMISQNNHIPRIKSLIERLCNALGEQKEFLGQEYHAFPTPEAFASCGEEYYRELGLGYRAPYIAKAARAVTQGLDLEEISSLGTYAARKKLLGQLGIGPKVADCVLLFAYCRTDVFPVDTWMEKVYYDYYEKGKASTKQITDYFAAKFGNYSGYVQQYLFYYVREHKNKEIGGLL